MACAIWHHANRGPEKEMTIFAAIEPLTGALLTLVAGIVGWFTNRLLSKTRDRANRKTHFLAFIKQWKFEVENCDDLEKLAKDFNAKVHLFSGEASKVRRDLPAGWRHVFDRVCAGLRHSGSQIAEPYAGHRLAGRDYTIAEFDSLIRFLKNRM